MSSCPGIWGGRELGRAVGRGGMLLELCSRSPPCKGGWRHSPGREHSGTQTALGAWSPCALLPELGLRRSLSCCPQGHL